MSTQLDFMSTQLDLWDKPFHSITVYQKPLEDTFGQRSTIIRYDTEQMLRDSIMRILDQHEKNKRMPRIAYIYACARSGSGRTFKVITLDTYYPAEMETPPAGVTGNG